MLSEFDKTILNAVQEDFPLVPRPFAALAEQLHTDENSLLERLQTLKEQGYLRRLGAYFDSDELGYYGTLVALRVEPSKLRSVIESVNRYEGVTHNYEREGEYNLWFTVQSSSEQKYRELLDKFRELPGVERMMDLRSEKKYKVRVQFRLQ